LRNERQLEDPKGARVGLDDAKDDHVCVINLPSEDESQKESESEKPNDSKPPSLKPYTPPLPFL